MPRLNPKLQSLLSSNEKSKNNTLQGLSLQRALSADPPTTLTPHEWEQWYKEHGVPPTHTLTHPAVKKKRWWRLWR